MTSYCIQYLTFRIASQQLSASTDGRLNVAFQLHYYLVLAGELIDYICKNERLLHCSVVILERKSQSFQASF